MGKFYATKNKSTNSGNVFRATKNRSYDAAHAIRAEAAEKKRQEEMNGSYFEKGKSRFADYDALRAINPTALGSTAKERADAFKTKTVVINHNKSKLSNYDNLRPVNPTAVGSTPQERASALKNKTGIIEKNLEGKYGSLPLWDKLKKANELPDAEAKRLRGYAYRTASAEDIDRALFNLDRIDRRVEGDGKSEKKFAMRYDGDGWNYGTERDVYPAKRTELEYWKDKKAEESAAEDRRTRKNDYALLDKNDDFEDESQFRGIISEKDFNTDNGVRPFGEKISDLWDTLGETNNKWIESELKRLTYIYNTEGAWAAERYYDFMQDDLKKRKERDFRADFEKTLGIDHVNTPATKAITDTALSVATIGGSPIKSLEGAVALADKIGGMEVDRGEAPTFTEISETARQDISEDMTDVGRFFYNTAMSAGDSAVAAVVGGYVGRVLGGTSSSATLLGKSQDYLKAGEKVTKLLMSAQAVVPTLEEAEERGLSEAQGLGLALIAAAAEYVTESIGIDAFLSDPKNTLLYMLKNSAAEGIEEGLSSGINTIADALVAGDNSKISARVSELMKTERLGENAAFGKAFAEWVKETGIEVLAGAVSGLMFGIGGEVMNGIYSADYAKKFDGKEDISALIDEAVELHDKNSDGYALAEELRGKLDSGKKISSRKLYKLAGLNDSQIAENEENNSKKLYAESGKESDGEFASALMNLYESGDVGVYADTMRLYYKTGLEGGDVGAIEERFGSKADKNSTLRARAEAYHLGAAARQRIMSDNADSAVLAGKELSDYTPEKRAELQRYFDSADQRIIDFYNAAVERGVSTKETIELSPVSERAAADIYEVTGAKVSGFKTSFGSTAALHIDKRHGTSGEQDHSMADVRDVARIQYVLDNYDDAYFGGTAKGFTVPSNDGKSSKNAKTVVFAKKINGTYYVVEAVPETNKKTVHIVSAYINKKGAQRPVGANAENGVHPRYVRNVTTDTPVNSITEKNADVKEENPTTAKGGPPPFNKGGYAAKDRTGRLDKNTRAVFDAIGRAFDVDIEYAESLDDGSWGRMETALRRMTVSEESANPLSTAIHEQVHLMKVIAPEAYKALERYTMWALDQEGADVDAMINRKIAQYEGEAGFGYDEAVEELVCDATENIQNADDFEGRFAQFLSEEGYTHSEAKAVVEKIAEFFRKIRDALKSVLDSLRARHGDNVTVTEAGAALSANIDVANRQLELFLALSRMSKQRYAEIRAGMADMPEGVVKRMISGDFYREFDNWDGKNPSITFTIGTTSEALRSINVKNQEFKMRSGMIINKINKHPEITREIVRQIPQLLEDPVIVQFSDAIDPKTNKAKYDSRISVMGELYTEVDNGRRPVLVSVELLPTNQRKTKILDFSVVTSAYAKNALQKYINDNTILYLDPNKKRTDKWLSLNRLQLPVGENRYGPIRSIAYSDGKVKISNSRNKTTVQLAFEKAGIVDEYGDVKAKSQKAPDPDEVEKLKKRLARRDGKISRQSEVIDKLKNVVEKGGAGTVPYTEMGKAVRGILKEYSSKYSSDLATAELSDIFVRIKNSTSSVEQRGIYRDILSLAGRITLAAEAKVVESTEWNDDCAAFLKDMRKGIALTETQKQDLAVAYGSFGKARNAYMGCVNFKNKGTGLDALWNDLREYDIPYSLPSQNEIAEGDMIHELLRAVDAVYNLKKGVYNPLFENAKGEDLHPDRAGMERRTNAELATRLFDMLTEKPETLTEAAVTAERQALRREFKVTRDALIDETRAQRREFYEKKRMSELRERIRKDISKITTAYINPKGENYIPEDIRSEIEEVLLVFRDSGSMSSDTARRIERFQLAYENIQNLDFYERAYTPRISAALKSARLILSEKGISELNYEEMLEVYSAVCDAINMIAGAKDARKINKGKKIDRLAADGIREIDKNSKYLSGANRMNLSPYRTMKILGGFDNNSTFGHIAEACRQAMLDKYAYEMEAKAPFEKLAGKKRRDRKRFKEFVNETVDVGLTSESGESVPINRSMMMQIILTYEREEASGFNVNHLSEGGIIIPDLKLLKKGKFGDAFKEGSGTHIPHIFKSQVERMRDVLRGDDYTARWMEAIRAYFDKTQYNAMNKIHLELFGRQMHHTKKYFPLQVNGDYVYRDTPEALKHDKSFRNAGFYKTTSSNATQPLNIMGVDMVIEESIETTSDHVGYALVMDDLSAILNAGDGNRTLRRALSGVFPKKGGNFLETYISDVTVGRKKDDGWFSSAYNFIRGGFVSKQLSFNTSVRMGQFSAYYTAGAVISPWAIFKAQKDFFAINAESKYSYFKKDHVRKLWEKLDPHTPILYMRRQGLSSAELAELNKAKSIPDMLKIGSKFSQGADVICATWIAKAATYDVDAKIKREELKIEHDSEEYWKAVARLTEDAILNTQDMHDPLFSAEFLKSTGFVERSLSLFQTQTFQTHGIIKEAITEKRMANDRLRDTEKALNDAKLSKDFEAIAKAESALASARKKSKAAAVKLTKSISAVLFSAIIYRAIKVIMSFVLRKVNPFRDDDGELTARSIAANSAMYVITDLVGTLSPSLSAIGVYGGSSTLLTSFLEGSDVEVKDLILTLKDMDYENASLTMISDFVSVTEGFVNGVLKSIEEGDRNEFNGKKEFYEVVKSGLGIFGFPLQNIENIYNGINGWIKHGFDFDADFEYKNSQIYDVMYEAMLKGDEKKLEKYRERALENKLDYSAIDGGIASRLQDHPTLQEYAEAYDESNWEEYDRLYGELKALGFKDDVIFSARDGYLRSLLPDEEFYAGEDDDGTKKEYDTGKLVDAIGERDVETVDRIMEWYEDAGKNPRSSITQAVKPDWRALDEDGRAELEDFLIDHCGYKEDYDFDEWILKYNYEDLYDAIDGGDPTDIPAILENFAEAGRDDKKIREAIKKHYKDLYKKMNGDEKYRLSRFLVEHCGFPEKYPFYLWENKN